MTRPPFESQVPDLLAPLASVAAARLDGKGRVLDANEGFARLADRYGVDRDDARGLFRQPGFEELTAGSDTDGWTLAHEGIVNLGSPGGEETVSLDGTVHRGPEGLVLLAEHDPDRQRELRDRVLELNEELTAAQREMNAELRRREQVERDLNEKTAALERSNEQLQEFAYVVSHDLQEPLRMVRSYLQLLENRYEGELDDEAHEFIDYAVDGATRMREMIQALLEYSRVQTQGQPPEPVDVDEVLEGVLANLHVRVEETDAEVTVGELGTVLADSGQLSHLLQNLVDNALKYAGPSAHVEIRAEPTGDGDLRISVADDGPGIGDDDRDELFKIFQRGKNARGQGTGIGLAVCKRIVERHGGEIGVESEPGEGATFWFTLPLAGEGEEAGDQAPEDGTEGDLDPDRSSRQ